MVLDVIVFVENSVQTTKSITVFKHSTTPTFILDHSVMIDLGQILLKIIREDKYVHCFCS